MRKSRFVKVLSWAAGVSVLVGAYTTSAAEHGSLDDASNSPMTVHELTQAARAHILPIVESDAEFDSLYIEQSMPPVVVTRVSRSATRVHQLVANSGVVPDNQIRVDTVGHSKESLKRAAERLVARDVAAAPSHVHSADVDLAGGHVVAKVDADELAVANERSSSISSPLGGVPIAFEEGKAEVESACTSRINCYSPHRAGIQIRRASTSGPRCAMGFHLTYQGDKQFLGAGHCSYGSKSNNWYHAGSGYVGTVQQNLMYAEDDLMRVSMSDSGSSSRIYAQTGSVSGWDSPMQGASIRASMAETAATVNGVVQSAYTTWWSNSCNCQMRGGRATGLDPVPGDSGSPVYEVSGMSLTAIGIVNTTGGAFARLDYAMNSWSNSAIP